MKIRQTRRHFLRQSASLAIAAPVFRSAFARAASPDETLHVAGVGVGAAIPGEVPLVEGCVGCQLLGLEVG